MFPNEYYIKSRGVDPIPKEKEENKAKIYFLVTMLNLFISVIKSTKV
jgi:hypothetical protein